MMDKLGEKEASCIGEKKKKTDEAWKKSREEKNLENINR